MKTYYDTGIILKLYTEESGSDLARAFVTVRGKAVFLSSLHAAEVRSALRLKQFRGECEPGHVARAIGNFESDFQAGVLKSLPVDWEMTWQRCQSLSEAHAATTGCRTLDSLHVACALLASSDEFITSDRRQLALGRLVGLQVINPFM